MAPRLSRPTRWNVFLANVDAQGGDGSGLGFGHARHGIGSLLLWPLRERGRTIPLAVLLQDQLVGRSAGGCDDTIHRRNQF